MIFILSPENLIEIKNLNVSFKTHKGYFTAVNNINLNIYKNEIFALVGESGSGKSATALSIINLHNKNYTAISGEIIYQNQNLLTLTEKELNKIRNSQISMVFQDSLLALNPMMKIGPQIEEAFLYHFNMTHAQRQTNAYNLLTKVGLPHSNYTKLPHQLSGGMRQRVMIAIAIACKPKLIIADEPTTALDVTIQATILDLLRSIQKETNSSILLITHDLGVVAELADRVCVMYKGKIIETNNVVNLFQNPQHSYTKNLLNSIL